MTGMGELTGVDFVIFFVLCALVLRFLYLLRTLFVPWPGLRNVTRNFTGAYTMGAALAGPLTMMLGLLACAGLLLFFAGDLLPTDGAETASGVVTGDACLNHPNPAIASESRWDWAFLSLGLLAFAIAMAGALTVVTGAGGTAALLAFGVFVMTQDGSRVVGDAIAERITCSAPGSVTP